MGLDFFRRVVELQRPYRDRKEIRNTLQTNGLSLDEEEAIHGYACQSLCLADGKR